MKEKFINGLIEIISAIYLSNTFKEIIKVSQDILKKLAKITNSDTFDFANGILKSVSAITLSLLTITPVNAPDAPQMPDVPVNPGISLTDLSLADLLKLVNEMNSQVDDLIRSNTASPVATSEGQEVEFSQEQMTDHILKKFCMTDKEYNVLKAGILAEVYDGNKRDTLAVVTCIYNRTISKRWNNYLYFNLGVEPKCVYTTNEYCYEFNPYEQYTAPYQFATYTDGTCAQKLSEITSESYDGKYDEQLHVIDLFLCNVGENLLKTPNAVDENGNAIHINNNEFNGLMHNFCSFKAWEENRNNYVSPGEPWVNFCEKYGQRGNNFHDPLVANDIIPFRETNPAKNLGIVQYDYDSNTVIMDAEGPSLN